VEPPIWVLISRGILFLRRSMDSSSTRKLDVNEYSSIAIKDDIYVYGKSIDYETITSGKPFSNYLVDMSYKEKANEVIRYFLRNNSISGITYEKVYRDYPHSLVMDSYMNIESISNKKLKILDNNLNDEIIKEIYDKYYLDRFNNYFNSDADCIEICFSNSSSYYTFMEPSFSKYEAFKGKKIMHFNLLREHDKLNVEEEYFLKRVLEDISDIKRHEDYSINGRYRLYEVNNKVLLNIQNDLDVYVSDLVKNMNKVKVKNMKMEEFL